MSDLNDIYAPQLLEMAAHITHTEPLANPDVTADAHAKLCGSKIYIELNIEGNRIVGFGQKVEACLLGQSSAAIVARHIIGSSINELRDVGQQMTAMLKEGGLPPQGRWKDLGLLQSVQHFKARHASTLLIFTALEKAFETYSAREAQDEPVA